MVRLKVTAWTNVDSFCLTKVHVHVHVQYMYKIMYMYMYSFTSTRESIKGSGEGQCISVDHTSTTRVTRFSIMLIIILVRKVLMVSVEVT